MRVEKAAPVGADRVGHLPGRVGASGAAVVPRKLPRLRAGLDWVSALGPFDEHLVRDVGGFFLAFAALGAFAVTRGSRETVQAVGLAWTVFQAPHVASHVALADTAGAETMLQLVALVAQLGLAVFVLVSASLRASSPGPAEGST